ncbi:MAG: hypothetical protein ACYC49_09885 [Ignavibacteriaceae bacterium]
MKVKKPNNRYITIAYSKLLKWQKELWKFCDSKFFEVLPDKFKNSIDFNSKQFDKINRGKYEQAIGHLFFQVQTQILFIGTENNPYILSIDNSYNYKLNYKSLKDLIDSFLHTLALFSEFIIDIGNLKFRSPIESMLFTEAYILYMEKRKPLFYYTYRKALKEINEKKQFFNNRYIDENMESLLMKMKNFRTDIRKGKIKINLK